MTYVENKPYSYLKINPILRRGILKSNDVYNLRSNGIEKYICCVYTHTYARTHTEQIKSP